MTKPIILGSFAIGLIAFLAGFAWQTGKIDDWRTPGLAQCEAYTKAGLRSPSSYHRVSFVVVDTPVTKDLLAEATGGSEVDKSLAGIANAPGIRGIALDYDAENGFGAVIRGGTACYFPMSDITNGEPSGDLDSMQRMAASTAALGRLGVDVKNDTMCCLSPKFDIRKIPLHPLDAQAAADASSAAEDAS